MKKLTKAQQRIVDEFPIQSEFIVLTGGENHAYVRIYGAGVSGLNWTGPICEALHLEYDRVRGCTMAPSGIIQRLGRELYGDNFAFKYTVLNSF
ncbi:MAG: hypothetical protein KGJ13_08110 [Patescibacteria group bacterium]|nr:hypothetical protein [Patescibacteria group bacterium]